MPRQFTEKTAIKIDGQERQQRNDALTSTTDFGETRTPKKAPRGTNRKEEVGIQPNVGHSRKGKGRCLYF